MADETPKVTPPPAPARASSKVIQPSAAFINNMVNPAPAPSLPVIAETPPTVPVATTETVGAPLQGPAPEYANFSSERYMADEQRSNTRRLLRRVAIIFGVIIVILALIGGAFAYATSLHTVTYDNGVGSTFKLSFYGLHKTTLAGAGNSAGIDPNTKRLDAVLGKNSERPLTVNISATARTAAGDVAFAANSGCARYPVAATVHNAAFNSDVKICSIATNGVIVVELASFQDSTNTYVMIFAQPEASSSGMSPAEAQALLAKYGLAVYQDDINTIVTSVRLAQ